MKKLLSYLVVISALIQVSSCQKELSYETEQSPAQGSLQDDGNGNCLPKKVNGAFLEGTALLPDSNTVQITVNVTKKGTYFITTDTLNGYFFKATGVFTSTGITQVTLKGNGNPLASGIDNFSIRFGNSACIVSVNVLPAGTGAAVFTLSGSPGNCTNAQVDGVYSTGTALSYNNTVTISVNVTTIGTYNISTTYQGMTFSGNGSFSTPGIQSVTLNGSGTPTTGGANVVPITAGSTTCSFTVNVLSPAEGTISCGNAIVKGLYVVSTALVAGDSVLLEVNVTKAGAYDISTDNVNGFSFSGSGEFTTTGNQTVTLAGTGTPSSTGNTEFTVSFGNSNCTFSITVKDIDYFPRTVNSNWSYEINNNVNDSLRIYVIPDGFSTGGNNYTVFMRKNGMTTDTFGYFRRDGNDYFLYENISYFGLDDPAWGDYAFLKDAAAGTTWNSTSFSGTVQGTPVMVRIKFTINSPRDISTALTTSTGTKTYYNVLVVKEELEGFDGTNWVSLTSSIGYILNYYARNIGMILQEVYDGSGSIQSSMALRRSEVF
ncbi:MAG: hypothetical protein LC128_12360 [Chitinophagales bacterium]|nr:hypothetical protein [Chitinophagales bacterium]